MEQFIQKLIALPFNYIIIALIAFFYIIENFQTTANKATNRLDHLFNNVLCYLLLIGASYCVALLQVYSVNWINSHYIGLLNQFNIPFGAKIVLGVFCIDFTLYWSHRLSHRSALLWRLHRVHHSDTHLDASTYFRHHPLDVFVGATWVIVATAVFGIDTITLGFYYIILTPCMIAQHTNVSFPKAIDSILGKLIVTPNFHKLHHAQEQFYTDSNFADIFIIWDRMFGTYKAYPPQPIVYGLKEFDEEKKQTFWFLMKSPFIKFDK
ncbi:sterol desaturase family protein [Segetibacter aerophilus]|uniref:Sterol desaturase n=1 Tax=Segetibacter aerophilus TaxID=670293 RepID=A0A512B8T5_9BACT|nr:sterol desaturase family protein [Segetibacter aerophilus]GEO08375.1 sterol desaturase [Segetibacter aerophilus]